MQKLNHDSPLAIAAGPPASSPGALLMIGNFLSASGGTLCVCEELSQQLAGAGWQVVTASDEPQPAWRMWDMLRTIYQYRREYEVAHVEVYHARAFCWAEASCASLAQLRKPYVLTLHGGKLPEFAKRWPRRTRRLLRSAAAVTVPSRYFGQLMAPYRPGLRLLPNALDLRAYRFRLRTQPAPNLVWLRAFRKIYNPVLALEVLRLLLAEFPGIHLTMIGPDKGDGTWQNTEQAATRLAIADRVQMAGSVPKSTVPGALAAGDIFLNTTNGDNMPVSVIEAMACGLCVVSTNVAGLPYLLEHEQDALLVPPNDPAAMAGAIRRLLTEPGLAERLSRRARAKASQFDWTIVRPQWETLLTAVAEGTIHD